MKEEKKIYKINGADDNETILYLLFTWFIRKWQVFIVAIFIEIFCLRKNVQLVRFKVEQKEFFFCYLFSFLCYILFLALVLPLSSDIFGLKWLKRIYKQFGNGSKKRN